MKITFLDRETLGMDLDLSRFKELGDLFINENTSYDERESKISDSDVVVLNKVLIDRPLISRLNRLKLICLTATGTNNVDLDAARDHGIAVCNVRNYSTASVAQHTFSLLLYLMEHLGFYDEYTKSGKYSESDSFTHLGKAYHEIDGKNWGIIGMGNIGQKTAEIATAFGARVSYYSSLGVDRAPLYPRMALEDLLRESDIISIHSPINERTRNLLTAVELKRMKPSAFLINVGRGGIINEKDLSLALDEGWIAGAGLDVLEIEPLKIDNPLMKLKHPERVFITPHTAWASVESRNRCIDIVYENIVSYLRGGINNRVEI